jgi:hypothetical protein
MSTGYDINFRLERVMNKKLAPTVVAALGCATSTAFAQSLGFTAFCGLRHPFKVHNTLYAIPALLLSSCMICRVVILLFTSFS